MQPERYCMWICERKKKTDTRTHNGAIHSSKFIQLQEPCTHTQDSCSIIITVNWFSAHTYPIWRPRVVLSTENPCEIFPPVLVTIRSTAMCKYMSCVTIFMPIFSQCNVADIFDIRFCHQAYTHAHV